MTDPIPSAAARVIDLFHGPFEGVRFPDADRASLDADAHAVLEAARAVEEAEQILADAREALDVAQRALSHRAQRALSYARVFAEGRPELVAALGEAPAANESAPAPRRRRSKKAEPEATELLPDLAAE